MMPGRALKVCVGGWVDGGVESEFSDRFGYSLALAKPNNSILWRLSKKIIPSFGHCLNLHIPPAASVF